MSWKKLGILLIPNPIISWISVYVGPSFVRVVNDKVLVYVSGRDVNNISRVGIVEVEINNEEHNVIHVNSKPCLDIGKTGLFDESGASYPWIVEDDGKHYMYYVGWVAGGKSRFQNYLGIAVSEDGGRKFKRIKNTPILDRNDREPFGSGSCCVYKEAEKWVMYYTSFEPWKDLPNKNRPTYNIKMAISNDLINWKRTYKTIVDFKDNNEYVICKPIIIKDQESYKLWYSYRTGNQLYRIGFAESIDNGKNYIRKDESVGIDVSINGWDSKMIEYAFIFDYKGERYMIYNGNDFGKTGLGIAIWGNHE